MADFDTAQRRSQSGPSGSLAGLALAAAAFLVCLALFANAAAASGSGLFTG